ncbi:MAG: hypothetical protein A3E92_01680 [Candidatus Taylorbacteria bacterium RIFCSPHIGHO2_12_FULL_42_34]|nr:MAG: hypothetical protein A3E92_01680 [Candidatus Taylorbacteria bacterium RIFCSPHIGHO2_12_FULL_42_34]
MRKQVVFFWSKEHKDKFLTDEYKYPTFRSFASKANEHFDYFLAFGKETHIGKGIFKPVFKFKNNKLVEHPHEVSADVVLKYDLELEGDRGNARFIYNLGFNEMCKNKIDTYQFLSEFSPQTHFCKSEEQYVAAIKNISTEKFAVKPNRGVCGRDVYILNKANSEIPQNLRDILHGDGVIVQEFIDTSQGCPGIAESMHDLRLSMINDKNIMASVSTPSPGSLIANWHQGANVIEVDVEKLPLPVTNFRDQVHKKIKEKYGSVMYNIDLGVTSHGPKLIELNSPIAFPRPNWKCTDLYLSNLIKYIDSLPLH